MIKLIIFGLLFLILFTKSLSADSLTGMATQTESQNVSCLETGILTTNSATGFFFVIKREIVEWRTISKTTSVCDKPAGCLIMHGTALNQVGTKYLVMFAQIEWKGKIKEFELERTPIKSDTALERTISESPISITMDN